MSRVAGRRINLRTDTTWQRRGACHQHPNPSSLWFAHPNNHKARDGAKAICNTCPVKPDCLAWSILDLYQSEHGGIMAATTREDRRELRTKMKTPGATWHGTPTGYYKHACKCEACKHAARLYRRQDHRSAAHARNQARYRNRKRVINPNSDHPTQSTATLQTPTRGHSTP